MRNRYALLACALFTFVTGTTVRAEDQKIYAALSTRYIEMHVAMATHDDKALAAFLAPEFESVDVDGHVSGADAMIKEVDSIKPDPLKQSSSTILSVQPSGDTVFARTRYEMKTVKAAADGTKRNVELIAISRDTWLNQQGNWLLRKTETEEMDYSVNGHVVIHKTASWLK